MTTQTRPVSLPLSTASRARARAPGRHALAGTLAALALLAVDASAAARSAGKPRAASAPTTAQILAPSQAAVPDALPPAAQVFRCGNSYSPHPCDGARKLDVADPRSEAQRAQAADIATRDKRLAEWLAAGRRDRERPAAASTPAKTQTAKPCKATKQAACAPKEAASRRSATARKAAK